MLGLVAGDAEKDLEQAEVWALTLSSGFQAWLVCSPTVPSPNCCVCLLLPTTPHILFLPVLMHLGNRRNIWSWHMLHGSYFLAPATPSPSSAPPRPQHVSKSLPLHLTLLDRSPHLARDYGSAGMSWFARGPGHNFGKESTVLQNS